MDSKSYEELQESLVYYRTQFCEKVIRISARKFETEECDLRLDMKPGKAVKVHWKYDPKLKQDQIFGGEFGSIGKNRCQKTEGSNNQSNDSENLLKVTKMMKKMKYLKEVSEVDNTIKEIPDEVLIEQLQKRFGVQVY